MAIYITMPKLGLTMDEGTILKWYKKEEDFIKKGEPLFEVETDKTSITVECEEEGYLKEILVKEGQSALVGAPIAIIGSKTEDISEITQNLKVTTKGNEAKTEKEIIDDTKLLSNEILTYENHLKDRRVKATPRARKIAEEYGLNLAEFHPKRQSGRIVGDDILEYVQAIKKQGEILQESNLKSATPEREAEQAKQIDKQLKPAEFTIKRTIPVTGMRKIIAEKMAASKKLAPHIYLSLDADMTKVIELREKLLPSFIEKHNVKLSYNDILIKAVAVALKQNPIINSSFTEEEIILKEEINIGLAVALDDGLIVPVIKNADRKGLIEIAKETSELIAKARDRKLLPDDYYGGTFTISNLGMYDIENFSAIINQPETAILAVGKMMKKPVAAENDEIVVKPMMNLTLSCDHRAIDGAAGAKFLQNLKQILEEPINMIL